MSETDITIRRMAFEFPADMELVFIRDDPAWSYFFLGSWMMLPYLEPYLMRSIRKAMDQTTDPALKEEMRRFCAQEGNHYKAHALANEVVRSRHPGFAKLKELEAEIDAEFRAFSAGKSLRFNLAYAEGFEAMTSAMGRTQFELDVFRDMASPVRELVEWHVMEELEHRTVAFEAYEHVCGGYFYRLFRGIWAQWHYMRWGYRLAQCMLEADGETVARHAHSAAESARVRRRFMWKALPKILSIYMPWYSPRRIPLPAQFEAARQRYTAAAASLG